MASSLEVEAVGKMFMCCPRPAGGLPGVTWAHVPENFFSAQVPAAELSGVWLEMCKSSTHSSQGSSAALCH